MLLQLLQFFSARFLYLALHLESGSFPRPLTPREEAAAFEALRAGDAAAREKIIRHNLRLVAHIAKKYYALPGDQDDLISIGTIGLIKAVNTFQVERKIKLATYASRCIENEILMHLRKSSQLRHEVSLDDPLNVDWDGNELLLSDLLGSDPDQVDRDLEQEAERAMLLQAVGELEPREQTIVTLRFGLGEAKEHTQKEVADALGISQSYISRLEKRIIHRLRRVLEQAS